MRNEIKSIEKVMERLVARSNAGFNIYDEVFEINEILKTLKGRSNMSLLEIICNKLGVEIGEEWKGSDGNRYVLKEDGTLYMTSMCANLDISGYKALLTSKLRPIESSNNWKPKNGDIYYVPNVTYNRKYESYIWDDHEYDYQHFERGLVFKTEKEAVECTEKILEVIKNV